MATVPPPPALIPDAYLIVFVHHSAPRSSADDPVLGDCERLQILGRSVLGAAYTVAMLIRHPNVDGEAVKRHIDKTLQSFASRWVTVYDWRRMMQAVPPHVNLYDPQETMRLLETYAGAVVVQSGMLGNAILPAWIQALVDAP